MAKSNGVKKLESFKPVDSFKEVELHLRVRTQSFSLSSGKSEATMSAGRARRATVFLNEFDEDEEEEEDDEEDDGWGVVACRRLLLDFSGAVNVFVLKDTGDVLLTFLAAVIGTVAAEALMSCDVG